MGGRFKSGDKVVSREFSGTGSIAWRRKMDNRNTYLYAIDVGGKTKYLPAKYLRKKK